MKSYTAGIPLILLMSFMSVAWADSPRWQQRDRTVIQLEERREGGYRHGHAGHPHRHGAWGWSPLAAAALLGSTVYLANTYAQPNVSTIVVSPSLGYSPPRVAYFCQTSQQYYPYVPVCQVPWQVVSY